MGETGEVEKVPGIMGFFGVIENGVKGPSLQNAEE